MEPHKKATTVTPPVIGVEPKNNEKKRPRFTEDELKAIANDPYRSVDIIKAALRNPNMTDEERINDILKYSHFIFRSIINTMRELALAIQENKQESDHKGYIQRVYNFYTILKQILYFKDEYLVRYYLDVVFLVFRTYSDTVFTNPNLYHHGELFPGGEENYLQYLYIVTSLIVMVDAIKKEQRSTIPNYVDFRKADFKYGRQLEMYYNERLM